MAAAPQRVTSDPRDLAAVELLGGLTYGQLRAFQVSASAIAVAPDARTADRLASLAIREHDAYVLLRDHLTTRTDLAAAVIDRQKGVFDAYFDAVAMDSWRAACTFFAVGLPLAADFIRQVAPALSPETGLVVVGALADRAHFEAFALDQLQRDMALDPEAREDVRHRVADVLGRALTGFQGAIADTDALQVLLADGDGEDDAVVRRTAMAVLAEHRRRMHALGLEDLE